MRPHRQQWFVTARHRGRLLPDGDGMAPPHGIRHARQAGSAVALCGEGVLGWVIFWHLPFVAGDPDTCTLCADLVGSLSDTETFSPRAEPKPEPRHG